MGKMRFLTVIVSVVAIVTAFSLPAAAQDGGRGKGPPPKQGAKAPPPRGLWPRATPAQTTRFAPGLATVRFGHDPPCGQARTVLEGLGEGSDDPTGRDDRRQPCVPASGG